MTLLQLNYINEIYKCGSINKAAQNLFVSQSSISSSIKELEEEIGITIFNRSNRGIAVTDEGREFISYIIPIILQQKKIKDIYSDKININSPKLMVSAQRYPFCADAFIRFLSKHNSNKFKFALKETGMYEVIEDVSSEQSEIGIISISNKTEKFMKKVFSNHDVEFVEILKLKPMVFIRYDHPLAKKEIIKIDDLFEYAYVIFENNESSSINFSEEALAPKSYMFNKIIYINDRATVYNVMAYTNAFTTGSGILSPGFCDPRICSRPLDHDNIVLSLGYIKPVDKSLKENAVNFISILKEILLEES